MKNICVVGAGFMGTQIGLQCAVSGLPTWVVDVSEEALERAAQTQRKELDARVARGSMSAQERKAVLGRLRLTADLREGASRADLVIETINERLEMKREVFARLDELCPDRTILATNSSSVRISLIEDATRRPEKVINAHFFPPIWERPMLELMRGTATSDETFEAMHGFARSIGMTPLPVLKESTGFLFNRVWRAIKKETLELVNDGVARHEDVDRAWMFVTGMKIGPFGLMDMIGLDVVREIEMVYYRESGEERDAPPPLLTGMVERGELGVKTGKGFYTYPGPAFEETGWLTGRKEE